MLLAPRVTLIDLSGLHDGLLKGVGWWRLLYNAWLYRTLHDTASYCCYGFGAENSVVTR